MLPEAPTLTQLESPRPPTARVLRARQTALELALLALIAALVPLRHAWPAQVVLLALLVTAPGVVALRALRVPGDAILRSPVYIPCASILVLLAAGLGVDLVGPHIGVAEPLRTWPMLASVEALSLILLVIAATAPLEAGVPWRMLDVRVGRVWPLLLPLASGVGALRLNQMHSSAVAVGAMIAVGALLLLGIFLAGRMSRGQLSLLLYGAGLAAMWSFSLRSHFTYGFDISSEFRVVTSTTANGVWHTSHPHDAYGAMLSLTVLPATLHSLTGISSLGLLKAVYPLLFALFPVALFGIAQRFLDRRYAFIAAAFVVAQSYFFQEMPAIARQEIALLLFVALIAALLDEAMPKVAQWLFVALIGVGVAVSHYSTTYLAATMLAVALVLQLLMTALRRRSGGVIAVVAALVATVGAGFLWYSPVTHSSSNMSQFVSNVREHGLDLLPNAQPGQGPLQAYLTGNTLKHVDANRYEQLAAADYARNRRYVKPLPVASDPRYRLSNSVSPADATRNPRVSNALRQGQLWVSQLANLLAVLGALALVVMRRMGGVLRRVGILGVATLLVLGFVRLSGTAANAYNQERAFLQTMVPLAIAMACVLQAAAGRWRGLRALVPLAAALALAVLFVGTSGLRGAAVGGGTPGNLANSGEDWERFDMTAPELASATWIAGAPHGSLLYTDRYGQLRLLAASGKSNGVLLDITPKTLDQHAWVYAGRANLQDGRARGEVGHSYAVFQWPARYLDENYNLVYDNGISRVYHR
jgi:hypothetical protein